jgi:hypothetical protein
LFKTEQVLGRADAFFGTWKKLSAYFSVKKGPLPEEQFG